MADANVTPEGLARKWFYFAFVGAIAYVSVVYFFVYSQDVSQDPGWEPATSETVGHD